MIEAAGGVVLRGRDGTTEVLVIHRPRYGDWSLPKGKLDDGEDAEEAARREVAEETGVDARPDVELPPVTYATAAGEKRVRWWLMHPRGGDPADRPPDGEVDAVRWVAVGEAFDVLTYERERVVLAAALEYGHDAGRPEGAA